MCRVLCSGKRFPDFHDAKEQRIKRMMKGFPLLVGGISLKYEWGKKKTGRRAGSRWYVSREMAGYAVCLAVFPQSPSFLLSRCMGLVMCVRVRCETCSPLSPALSPLFRTGLIKYCLKHFQIRKKSPNFAKDRLCPANGKHAFLALVGLVLQKTENDGISCNL